MLRKHRCQSPFCATDVFKIRTQSRSSDKDRPLRSFPQVNQNNLNFCLYSQGPGKDTEVKGESYLWDKQDEMLPRVEDEI